MFGNLLKTKWGKVQACIMVMGIVSFLLLCVTVNCNCAFGKIMATLASSCCAAVVFWSACNFLPEYKRRCIVKKQLLIKYMEIKRRLIEFALKSLMPFSAPSEVDNLLDCAEFDRFSCEIHEEGQDNWDAIISDWANNKSKLNDVRFLVKELADSIIRALSELQCSDEQLVEKVNRYVLTVKTVLNQSDYQDNPAKYIGEWLVLPRLVGKPELNGKNSSETKSDWLEKAIICM